MASKENFISWVISRTSADMCEKGATTSSGAASSSAWGRQVGGGGKTVGRVVGGRAGAGSRQRHAKQMVGKGGAQVQCYCSA